MLRFSTSREQGLGDALPAGTVRVYQRDARGNPQFVGESAIGHTPMGSELGLTTGQAFDVKVQREPRSVEQWRERAPDRTADDARSARQTDALHADQRPAASRSRSTSIQAGLDGWQTPGSSRKAMPSERPLGRRGAVAGAGAGQWRRRSSPRPSRPATEAGAAVRRPARLWPLLLALAAAPAAAQTIVTSPGPDRCRGHRLSRSATAAPATPLDLAWLNGFALISETRRIVDPGRRIDDPLRRRRRRHRAAERDRHRLSRRHRRAQPRRLSALARTLLDRSLGRRVHLRRTSRATGAVTRAGGGDPQRRRRRGRAADRRRVRGAALHRPARDARL